MDHFAVLLRFIEQKNGSNSNYPPQLSDQGVIEALNQHHNANNRTGVYTHNYGVLAFITSSRYEICIVVKDA
jgi:hypothetical protein